MRTDFADSQEPTHICGTNIKRYYIIRFRYLMKSIISAGVFDWWNFIVLPPMFMCAVFEGTMTTLRWNLCDKSNEETRSGNNYTNAARLVSAELIFELISSFEQALTSLSQLVLLMPLLTIESDMWVRPVTEHKRHLEKLANRHFCLI